MSARLTTQRLTLRPCHSDDLPALVRLFNHPSVAGLLGGPRPAERCAAELAGYQAHFDQHGIGLFALDTGPEAPFIGLVGARWREDELPITPCWELCWSLCPAHWGKGLVPEAARAVVSFAFEQKSISELVAVTSCINHASQRVMHKLGMVPQPERQFDHPDLPAGHGLRPHQVYILRNGAHG
jgi:RimJ/RimL family protein N-acetyltransferase